MMCRGGQWKVTLVPSGSEVGVPAKDSSSLVVFGIS